MRESGLYFCLSRAEETVLVAEGKSEAVSFQSVSLLLEPSAEATLIASRGGAGGSPDVTLSEVLAWAVRSSTFAKRICALWGINAKDRDELVLSIAVTEGGAMNIDRTQAQSLPVSSLRKMRYVSSPLTITVKQSRKPNMDVAEDYF